MIDHRTADFEACARRITGGPAVGFILDAVGGYLSRKGYPYSRRPGRLGISGVSSGATDTTGGILGMLSMLASAPWLQFNPLVSDERQ